MEILGAILSWTGGHWEYILIGYLAGAAGNTSVGKWIVKLPVRPLMWAGTKLMKKET